MNNYFGYCKSAAIATNLDVNGIVSKFELLLTFPLDLRQYDREERSRDRAFEQQVKGHLQYDLELAPEWS